MPLRSSGCLLLLLLALSPLVAGSKSSLDVSGQRIAVLYVGLPCRFHSFKHLPNLWHNQETLLLRPLRQHYSTVDVYGFFNEHKVVDGVNYGLKNHMQKNYEPPSRTCMEQIPQLTKWQQLVFSDTDEELFEEGMTSGEMGDRRRFVALRRFTTTQVNSTLKCAYDRVLVLRPDLWFRQPWSAWNISERVDLHVSHWECDGAVLRRRVAHRRRSPRPRRPLRGVRRQRRGRPPEGPGAADLQPGARCFPRPAEAAPGVSCAVAAVG